MYESFWNIRCSVVYKNNKEHKYTLHIEVVRKENSESQNTFNSQSHNFVLFNNQLATENGKSISISTNCLHINNK